MSRVRFLSVVVAVLTLGVFSLAACGSSGGGDASSGPPSFFIYAADGKAGVPGNLYVIDPTNGAATVVGPIGYAVTGLAYAPTGVLYATESIKAGGDARLLQIDPETGAGTVVGPLDDASGTFNHNSIADLTWIAGRLIGWTETGAGSSGGDCPVEIEKTTGVVTVIGGTVRSSGDGLAADASGRVYFVPQGSSGPLYELDPMSGLAVPTGVSLRGADIDGNVNSMTFLNGALYLTDNTSNGVPTSPNDLYRVSTTTGMLSPIGPLPPGIDAIAGSAP